VYRASRKSDNQLVAVKKISIDMMDQKARTKTLKEGKLLQTLNHPNIIAYLDSFIVSGRPKQLGVYVSPPNPPPARAQDGNELIIVFEWAAAGDLKRQIRKAQERNTYFDERVVWKYFSQIVNAISHMHDERVMHRDLKPANIFLTLNGTVKVGDLGLGRALSEDTMEAHSKVGTPLYMSPEVLRGDGYDWKSDIWR
jgi:NIMA (never in mitosis gene a)-related kinase